MKRNFSQFPRKQFVQKFYLNVQKLGLKASTELLSILRQRRTFKERTVKELSCEVPSPNFVFNYLFQISDINGLRIPERFTKLSLRGFFGLKCSYQLADRQLYFDSYHDLFKSLSEKRHKLTTLCQSSLTLGLRCALIDILSLTHVFFLVSDVKKSAM